MWIETGAQQPAPGMKNLPALHRQVHVLPDGSENSDAAMMAQQTDMSCHLNDNHSSFNEDHTTLSEI